MTSGIGYIVNIPLYFGGNEEKLEADIEKIFESQSFASDRSFKILIGLNQKEGTLSPELIQSGIAKAKRIVAEHLPKSRDFFEVEVIDYEWSPFGTQQGPNYSDIRNKILRVRENNRFYTDYKKAGYDTILYLTIDPDSKVTENIFQKVEHEVEGKVAPIVQVGTFQFEVEDSQLIRADGTLNWQGFLAERETRYDSLFKEEISQDKLGIVKYPYISINNDLSDVHANYIALRKLRKRIDKNEKIPVQLEDLDLLIKKYHEICTGSNELDSATKQLIYELEEKIGIENLNFSKKISGASILYPPEPILFITLFQRYNDEEFDFRDLILQSFDKNQPLWGDSSHIREGETMAINIRKIWRENKANFQLNKRDYVRFSFDYKTQIPERALRIPESLLTPLPRDIQSLKKILESDRQTVKLMTRLKVIVASRGLSSLSKNFIDQRIRSIKGVTITNNYKPSRFGEVTAQVLSKSVKEYIEAHQERYVEMLLQDILESIYSNTRSVND